MPAQVIVKLIADPSGLQPGIDELEQLGKVDKDTASQFNATNKAFQERAKVVQGASTASDKLAEASKKLVESIAGGAITQASNNIEKIAESMDEVNKETLILNKTLDLAKKKLGDLDKDSPEFDKLSKEIQASELALANMGKEATSSRQQLRQYRETLLQLEDAGLDGTEVFNNMAIAAGELEDQIGDTSARIKALASDTFELDAGVEIAQGVAAGFAVAQGATALFGEESEDLQKTLLKVNAAMSILQGLQQIQNLLQAQSNASIAISLALKKLETLQTNLQAAAESRNIVIRYAAIVAQKALNAVMALNPAGILLLAIGALAGTLLVFSQNTETAAETQERLNAALEKTNASLDDQIEVNERLRNTRAGALNDQQQQLDVLKANGALQSQILSQERKVLQAQLENEKVRKASLAGQKGREQEFEDAASNIVKIERDLSTNVLDVQNAQQDESLKSAAAFADARVAQTQKGTQAELNAQIAAIKAKRKQDIADTSITAGDRARIIADSERQIADLRQNFRREQFNQQVAALQAESAITLDLAKKLELDRSAVILKAQADSLGKTKEQQEIIEKQKQASLKQIDNDATIAVLSNRLALYRAAAINEKDNALKSELEKEAIIVQAQIDSVGKTAEEVLRIEKQKQADITAIAVDAERKRGQLQLILLRRQGIGETDEVKKLENQKQQAILQAQIDSAGASKDERALIEAQLANDIIEINRQIEQAKRNMIAQTLDVASSLLGSLSQISKDRSDYQLSLLQKQQEEEEALLKKRLENGLLTQEQYNKLQLASQEKYAAKEKAIRIAQAKQEKEIALFQAIINTASAVAKALPNIPLAVFAGILGAAQIAVIASKPIPAFKKGTKNAPGGPSLIGEAGAELYYADGKWGYAAKPTILDLPKGAKVIPAMETSKIMNKYDIPLPRIPSYAEVSGRRERIDYDKIGAAVGKQLEKLPLTINGYDKDGPFKHITTMQNRRQFLNKRYGRNTR